MATDPQSIIAEVFRVYCALTGNTPNAAVWQRRLYDYVKAGYTPEDMAGVLTWIMRENKRNDYKRSSSLFLLLDGEFARFDSYLIEARASNRNHKPVTPKAKVLQQWRGLSEPEVNGCARKVGQILSEFNDRTEPQTR